MKALNKIIIVFVLLIGQANISVGQQNPSEYNYVDLGLPSGTLWATCNIGANAPEECGDYFAWGETTTKTTYNWTTYNYCHGDYIKLTKYCNLSSYGYNGFTDNLKTLQDSDDAATANWGIEWCTPTAEQWKELLRNTVNIWTTQNGVNGRLFTADNGNSLFLPAAGGRKDDKLNGVGTVGVYWSSSLNTDRPGGHAWFFCFFSNLSEMGFNPRDYGHSIRPVRSGKTLPPDSDTLALDNETLIPEVDTLTSDNEILIPEVDTLTSDNETLIPDADTLTSNNEILASENEPSQTIDPPAPDTLPKVYARAYDGFVNIRQTPQFNAPVLGVLRNGPEGAFLLGIEGEWTKIDCNGIVGYVYSKYVQNTPTKVYKKKSNASER